MKKSSAYLAVLTLILFSSINASAKTYFIDSISGDDENSGISETDAWESLERVNDAHFNPGDKILFRRGMQWRGKLTVPSSGSESQPIIFSAYGSGENPVIMRTVTFSDWKPLNNTSNAEGKARIWAGRMLMLRNSWGMVNNGKNTPVHIPKPGLGVTTDTMADGYFFSPANSGLFYYRNDAGIPGTVEIGAYEEAIHIENRSHIILDGIDVYGPGGKQKGSPGTARGMNYKSIAISNGSSHIVITNLSISHGNSIGISADPTTANIVYDNLSSHHNGGTGIYMNSNGGRITNCRAYENGRLDNGRGDRGGIGSNSGRNITVEYNEVFRNGPDNGDADFDASFVLTGAMIIQRNYIHNCLQGCLQVAAGGDGSLIAYNIISGYGSARGKMSSVGKLSGIRIGGGGVGSKNIRIYNNVVRGGKQGEHAPEAALFVGPFDNSGLQVINNIFADNDNKHVYIAGGKKAKLDNSQFANNLFSSLKSGVFWKGTNYKTLKYLKIFTDLGVESLVGDPLFSNSSGTYNKAYDFALQLNSPAINRGVYVDIAGDYRNKVVPYGDSPDIGAFEFHSID